MGSEMCIRDSFETLHPNATLTDNAIEKQGDIIEIVIAALRGHVFFRPIFGRIIEIGGRRIPELLVVFFDLCKTVQYLDAFLTTGWLKHKRETVPLLIHRIPGMASDVQCAIWHCTPNIGWGLSPMDIQFGPIVACPLHVLTNFSKQGTVRGPWSSPLKSQKSIPPWWVS